MPGDSNTLLGFWGVLGDSNTLPGFGLPGDSNTLPGFEGGRVYSEGTSVRSEHHLSLICHMSSELSFEKGRSLFPDEPESGRKGGPNRTRGRERR